MIDYCMKPDEIKSNPNAPELLLKISAGNESALMLMWSFWCFSHLYDDLIDGDKKVSINEAAKELCRFIEQLSFNHFYIENRSSIHALLISSINRWVTGERMASSDDEKMKTMARVLRCGDIDLYLHVAYLVGGWDHMQTVSELMQFDKG